MIYKRTLLTESLNKPRIAVCGANEGNIQSKWKCLFNCSHKYFVELHLQNKFTHMKGWVAALFHKPKLSTSIYSYLLNMDLQIYLTLWQRRKKWETDSSSRI